MNIYMLYNVVKEQGKYISVSVDYTARGNTLNLHTNTITGVLLVSNDVDLPPIKDHYICDLNQYIVPQYDKEADMDIEWLNLLNEMPISEWLSYSYATTCCLCLITEDALSNLDIRELEKPFPEKIVIWDCAENATKHLFKKYDWNVVNSYR